MNGGKARRKLKLIRAILTAGVLEDELVNPVDVGDCARRSTIPVAQQYLYSQQAGQGKGDGKP